MFPLKNTSRHLTVFIALLKKSKHLSFTFFGKQHLI